MTALRYIFAFLLGFSACLGQFYFGYPDHFETAERMTCAYVGSKAAINGAIRKFIEDGPRTFDDVHRYMSASGFVLIQVAANDGYLAFSYRFVPGHGFPCLRKRTVMIDGAVVAVRTSPTLSNVTVIEN